LVSNFKALHEIFQTNFCLVNKDIISMIMGKQQLIKQNRINTLMKFMTVSARKYKTVYWALIGGSSSMYEGIL